MVKKKIKDKEEKTPQKKTKIASASSVDIDVFSISELLEMKKLKPFNAIGFLEYYKLTEVFKKEFESGEASVKFSEGEFEDMYNRYLQREI